MPTFKVNASLKLYFDREVVVEAASEDDAVQLAQEMVRTGQIPTPRLPDYVDGWETGEIDLLPDQLGGGFWSAYEAKSAG
jgi:hypothetical protein